MPQRSPGRLEDDRPASPADGRLENDRQSPADAWLEHDRHSLDHGRPGNGAGAAAALPPAGATRPPGAAPATDADGPRPAPRAPVLLAGALLTAVAALAWGVLVARATGWPGASPARAVAVSLAWPPASDRAAAVPMAPADVAGGDGRPGLPTPAPVAGESIDDYYRREGNMWDATPAAGADAEAARSAARLGYAVALRGTPPASQAAPRPLPTPPQTLGVDAEMAAAGATLIPARYSDDPATPAEAAPAAPAADEAAGALLLAAASLAVPLEPLASFLVGWALVVLAVVLPGAVPTLAAYGASHRAVLGRGRAATHALRFWLGAGGLWLLAGVPVYLAGQLAAAAAASPWLAARAPYALAAGLAALALYHLSPLREDALAAARRPASAWARRTASGRASALAAGRAYARASVAASGGLVVLLVVGAAAAPWAALIALALVAERVAPRAGAAARATGWALVAAALGALVWPAPALAAMRDPLPARATAAPAPELARLATLDPQADRVTALAFSRDGALLASAGDDGTVRLWDGGRGRPLRTLARDRLRPGGQAVALALAFSPGGATLAAANDDGSVTEWDVATGRPRAEAFVWPVPATALAFAPSGAAVAVGYADGGAALWDLRSRAPLWTRPATGAPVQALAFSPDGQALVSQPWYGPLTIRASATGRELRVAGPRGPLRALAFAPAGRLFLTGGGDAVTVFDAGSASPLRALPLAAPAVAVAFSADGAVLTALSQDGAVTSWRAGEDAPTRRARLPQAPALAAFAPRRMILATVPDAESGSCTSCAAVVLWDARVLAD